MYSSFYVRPSAGEQVQTTVSLCPDSRPALLGIAVGEDGKPLTDALVVLTASGQTEPDRVVGTMYTDELGQFSFGPLEAGTLYQVRVSRMGTHLRTLEQAPIEA
ncbi:MAG: carboxypeptidase-like regulatory domain-containing protein [Butyricicoccus sp.]